MSKTVKQQSLALIGFIALSIAVAALGSLFTLNNVEGWYAEAEKVAWNPPNWLFAPAWSTLYALIALAVWLIWRKTDAVDPKDRSAALKTYWIQLVLNAIWTPMFFGGYPVFGAAALWLGLVIIVCLAVSIILLIRNYHHISPLAAWLMVPYLLWILFATSLNAGVAILN
ncbi:MAG: TspO/MBR family protein [Microbacteriaceae bacterium]